MRKDHVAFDAIDGNLDPFRRQGVRYEKGATVRVGDPFPLHTEAFYRQFQNVFLFHPKSGRTCFVRPTCLLCLFHEDFLQFCKPRKPILKRCFAVALNEGERVVNVILREALARGENPTFGDLLLGVCRKSNIH